MLILPLVCIFINKLLWFESNKIFENIIKFLKRLSIILNGIKYFFNFVAESMIVLFPDLKSTTKELLFFLLLRCSCELADVKIFFILNFEKKNRN